MNSNVKMYLSVFFIYFAVDVAYQLLFGLNFSSNEYANAGFTDVLATAPRYPILFLFFFILITITNVELAVKPALEKENLNLAIRNGFLIGITAYGTLAMTNTWSFNNFPLTVMFAIIFEGILFSTIASGLTTKIFLPKES